jgi:tetratricopeptide (TPR) repeat protein
MMTKAIRSLWLGLGLVLVSIGTASADGSGSGSGSGSGTTLEKAGTDESLQKGGGDRPWAVGVKQSEQQGALKLFHDGNLQLNDGLFAKAAEAYKAALTHWDHPAIHYNLALAEMNLDSPIESQENFQLAIKFGEAPLQSKDKFDHAKDYILLLDKQIGEVEVTCKKPGTKVSLDGKEVFTAPGTWRGKVRAGKHSIVGTLEGHPSRVDAPYIEPGAPFRIELKLYTTAELTRYRRKWDATWMPYVVMGGGVLVGLAGGLMEDLASNDYKKYDDQVKACNAMTTGNMGCKSSSSLTSIKDSGDTKKNVGYALYGVGAAAVITGAVLWIINRPESYEVRPEDLNSPVSFQPVVSPTFAGAALSGRF